MVRDLSAKKSRWGVHWVFCREHSLRFYDVAFQHFFFSLEVSFVGNGLYARCAIPASRVSSEYTHPFGFPEVPDVYRIRHGLFADRDVWAPTCRPGLCVGKLFSGVRLYKLGDGVDVSRQSNDGVGTSLLTLSALPRSTLPG